jgi:hypothetical protein
MTQDANPPQDASEFARQRALDTYRVLDTFPEAAYDDIVTLASVLCNAPIALISLIDRDRQWFKSRRGIDLEEGRRDEAFCDHVIRNPGTLMEVTNATEDTRFSDNPFVTGEDHIRFYAGMPLVTPGGAAVGSVCVLDREPRHLDARQRDALAALARLTMNLLEARHREIELQRNALLQQAHPDPGPVPSPAASAPTPALVGTRAKAAPPEPLGFTVAIFEVQDLPRHVKARGDRNVGRDLDLVVERLQSALRQGSTDTVSHATGSAELIVVLHGNHTAPALEQLRALLPAIEAETGFHVLSAAADASEPRERVEMVFLRADEALSRAKDAARPPPRA